METRSITSSFNQDGNKLVGYCAVWNSPTVITENGRTFSEVVRPGAFRKAVESKSDIIATFNHDPNRLLGRVSSGTLSLMEDNHGLRFEVQLPEHAADIKELVQRGDLRGGSFTFSVRKNGEHWDGSTRELVDLYLHEVAPVVVMPAYGTTSVGLRSKDHYRRKLKFYDLKHR